MSVGPPRVARRRPGRDLRLLPAAIGVWISAAVLVGMPEAVPAAASAAWMLAIVSTIAAILLRSRERAVGGLAALALAVGSVALVATSLALRADIRAPPALADTRGPVEVRLVVTEEADAGGDRLRGTASMVGEAVGEMPVLVVGTRLEEDVGIGATLQVRGTVSPTGPGGGLAAIVVADGAAPEVLAPPPAWLEWGNAMRAGFRDVAAELPGDGGALLTGLAIGDDRGVPQTLADAMRSSSLTHLTAVSGANCAIVVGAVMIGGALLGVRRRWRIAGALGVLAAFVVLVTPQPSVVRAAVMAAFALGGLALARPMRGLPLLCLAVVGILIVDPWASRELGFVLSAFATAGLLVLSGPLGRVIAFAMPQRLALAIAVPLAAQLACQPAIAVIDASLPAYGVVANLLAVPAAPLATMAGLLACLAAPVLPPLATGLAWLAWLPSSWIGGVATTFAAMPAARLPWPEGIAGIGLYALLALAIAFVALGRGRARLVGGLVTGAIVAGFAGALAASHAAVLARPVDWQFAMCDVGQGDASVVRSAGAVAVIDAGPDPESLSSCLAELGIAQVDLLILTHFDRDHAGGSGALVGRVARVLTGPTDAAAETRVLGPLAAAGAVVEEVSRGDAGMLGALTWRILWPRADPAIAPGNDASVVVRFAAAGDGCPLGGCLTSVLLGDLGESAQLRLLASGPIGQSAVVKVSHHGSADQSERLYQAIAAPIALIGVGADNDYGHPTDRLLAMLARTGAEIGRTDEDGLLLVAMDAGGGLALWRAKSLRPPESQARHRTRPGL